MKSLEIPSAERCGRIHRKRGSLLLARGEETPSPGPLISRLLRRWLCLPARACPARLDWSPQKPSRAQGQLRPFSAPSLLAPPRSVSEFDNAGLQRLCAQRGSLCPLSLRLSLSAPGRALAVVSVRRSNASVVLLKATPRPHQRRDHRNALTRSPIVACQPHSH